MAHIYRNSLINQFHHQVLQALPKVTTSVYEMLPSVFTRFNLVFARCHHVLQVLPSATRCYKCYEAGEEETEDDRYNCSAEMSRRFHLQLPDSTLSGFLQTRCALYLHCIALYPTYRRFVLYPTYATRIHHSQWAPPRFSSLGRII